jgi:hypothetical protein
MDYEKEIDKITNYILGVDSHLGLRRVVGDIVMLYDDEAYLLLFLEDLKKILFDGIDEDDNYFLKEDELWPLAQEKHIPNISDVYESYARIFPTVRDALAFLNNHQDEEINQLLFLDKSADLTELILVPTYFKDGFFWFEKFFISDVPKIRGYANRDAQLKILTSDGTISPEEAEDYIKDSYLPEIEE